MASEYNRYSPKRLLLGVLNSFLRCVRPFCHCWCPPFSAGHAAFLFICLPGDFFTFVSQVRCLHCWCPHAAFLFICLPYDFFTFVSQVRCLYCWVFPFSAGHAAFLFICLPGDFFTFVSQVRCLHAGVRMQHFYSFVSHMISLLLSPRFGACTAGCPPFPLAMQHFYSFVSQVISLLLSPRFGASMLVSACSISIHLSPI